MDMEWLVIDAEVVVVYGTLLCESGKGADPAVYGNLAPAATNDECAAEYTWTRMIRMLRAE